MWEPGRHRKVEAAVGIRSKTLLCRDPPHFLISPLTAYGVQAPASVV